MQLNIWVTVVLPSDAVLVWFGLVFLLVVWFGLVLRIGDPCTSLLLRLVQLPLLGKNV